MSKTSKAESPVKKPIHFYTIHPWAVQHQPKHSEIEAYVEASGEWEIVLNVRSTSGATHETMAEYILSIIHEHQKKQSALQDAMHALELVLNEGITFSSEQAIGQAVTRIKKVLK